MAGSRPTQRTLDACRKFGWFAAGVVERHNVFSKRKHDLIGCIDVVAVPHTGCLGIQACRDGDHGARKGKAIREPRLLAWLEAGNRFEIWSWGKRGDSGKRKLWKLRREAIKWGDLDVSVRVLNPYVEQIRGCRQTTCRSRSAVLTEKRCSGCDEAWNGLDAALEARRAEMGAKKKKEKQKDVK